MLKRVPISFWSHGSYGAQMLSRTIAVPSWEEIDSNYPDVVGAALGALFRADFRPARGGQLMLWHGEPGTGKTYALRALAWEWRDWCALHYVTDPEAFFGARSDYMLEVLLDEADDADERWRLLATLPARWRPPAFPLRAADFLARGVPRGPRLGAALAAAEKAWIEAGFPTDAATLAATADAASKRV